jgi:hypothetical protein
MTFYPVPYTGHLSSIVQTAMYKTVRHLTSAIMAISSTTTSDGENLG